jgi:hypothetical protein
MSASGRYQSLTSVAGCDRMCIEAVVSILKVFPELKQSGFG